MSDFVIIPDTSCDLTRSLRERFGIEDYLGGLIYFPDGHSEVCDLDWERHDPKTFYESMSDKKTMYKTASPPTGETLKIFEKNLKAGKDILCITLSSALSGTYQACELVKSELMAKYPERKIVCIDSMRYSTALSLLVIMATMKRAEGASLEELELLSLGGLRKAVVEGDVVNGSLMAGQSAGLVKEEYTCKELIVKVVTEAEKLLGGR